MPADSDVIGNGHAGKRAIARKGGERLRLVPAQTAAEDAAAAAQFDRNEIVLRGGEPRTGKAHQNAAFLNPMRKAIVRIADIADIG